MDDWTQDEFMKHLARAEWILQNLRGVNLEEEEADNNQQDEDKEKLARKLVKKGRDPMMELYNPDKTNNNEPDIQGIDWRGEL
jgi:hypothetical protein